MAKNIQGLNFDSKLSIDDLKFLADVLEAELLERLRLTFGGESLSSPRNGVVDAEDPRTVVVSDVDRPLIVFPSENNPLLVNIGPGTAVTPNASIVRNPALIEDFELARTAANDIVVVFIENEIIDSPPTRKTRFNTSQPVRRTQDTTVIRSALLTDFNNAVLFPPSRKDNIVVLTVITVADTVAGLELQLDYSASSYSFNRPWFSPADVEHRARLGSGTSTENNPHGLSFSDLTSGTLTFYDQVLFLGLILSRDNFVKGLSGVRCLETITPSRILTDSLGDITIESRFGGIGARYIVLSRYPTWITSFYLSAHKGRSIVWDWIKGTRIVVLPDPETFSEDAVIEYMEVQAAAPPAALVSNTLTFGQPTDTELVISGGNAISEIANPNIEFDGSGPVPRNYTVYAKGDGTLLRSPELIQAPIRLDDIGTAVFDITAQFFGKAKLQVGLAEANPVPTMAITIRLTGRDENNNTLTEDISFSGSTWTDVALPGEETTSQFQTTAGDFIDLTSIQVQSRTDDGPNSKIIIWANLESEVTTELNNLAELAEVAWDGLAIASLRDTRRVVRTIPEPTHKFEAADEAFGLGGTEPTILASEDFSQPRYRNTATGTVVATNAAFSIFISDFSLIQAGDTISFPTGKTVTAITTGSPNRTLGEYLAATSDKDTRDDLVLTINDATFASGVTAVADTTDNSRADCTIDLAGAQGNGEVSEPVEGDPAAITLSGNAVGGIDAFGENKLPRHRDCIESEVPDILTYDVSGIRDRYQSVPFPVDNRDRINVIVHGIDPPHDLIQMRARVAIGTDPEWQPWEVVAGDGGFFTFTKADPITKVQIELFGKCCGYSIYEADN